MKTEKKEPTYIEFIFVHPGGCNSGLRNTEIKSNLPDETDKLYFSALGDTLHAFVGINYICCAPFATNADFNPQHVLKNLLCTKTASKQGVSLTYIDSP